ncbi:hypothetical protein CFC21_010670 [Triticum aestivum]|uniref:KIB1-4 beta-propeller domain-containing protein n=2 Tax=Triticum aestivum TaxID=4565 RepID=A0A3B5ZQ68_WHEAT|nr:hypothetical protein CFC21_010670 [Triticum aestivum]
MARSKGAAARRRKAATAKKANANANAARTVEAPKKAVVPGKCPLPSDVLAEIHERLRFLDRIHFASVFASRDDERFKPYAPWLLLPGKSPEKFELFSIADRRSATFQPAADPALRGHLVLGSSRGWLATADDRGQIYLVNPLSGTQLRLPHMSTMGLFLPSTQYQHFSLVIPDFLKARFGGGPPYDHELGPVGHGTLTYFKCQMREYFYRKVVLSTSPRPGSYAAMLIMEHTIGAPAFATTKHPAWRLAPSREGVDDAIHHDGRFYSVSYSGLVEAWERNAVSGAYTSRAVAPRLALGENEDGSSSSCHKYLAAAPGGRLMVMLKYLEVIKEQYARAGGRAPWQWKEGTDEGQWKEGTDIGNVALFVGVNNSLCLPTTERPQIVVAARSLMSDGGGRSDDELGNRSTYDGDGGHSESDLQAVGVYSLKDGTMKEIWDLGEQVRNFYPPPVWILLVPSK